MRVSGMRQLWNQEQNEGCCIMLMWKEKRLKVLEVHHMYCVQYITEPSIVGAIRKDTSVKETSHWTTWSIAVFHVINGKEGTVVHRCVPDNWMIMACCPTCGYLMAACRTGVCMGVCRCSTIKDPIQILEAHHCRHHTKLRMTIKAKNFLTNLLSSQDSNLASRWVWGTKSNAFVKSNRLCQLSSPLWRLHPRS